MKNSININLDRKQVITNLKQKRAEFDLLEQYARRKEAELAVAKEEWKQKTKEAIAFWIQQGDARIDSFYHCNYDQTTQVRLEFPRKLDAEPRWDNDTMGQSPSYYTSKIAEIDRSLALLDMCPDDTIKSKAYADILNVII